MVKGRIHSVESCGTVDGPGIRYVIFTQGCLLRCQYCHNADTWEIGKGKEITVEEVMQDVTCYLPFIEASGGGITVSGGEPLLQLDFLIELFKKCKESGIHTTIDSSGGCYSEEPEFQNKLDILMEYTDLVLLDLKHIDSKKHRKLTGKPNEHILQFARYLSDRKKTIWVRHVLVPVLPMVKRICKNYQTLFKVYLMLRKWKCCHIINSVFINGRHLDISIHLQM